MNPIQAMTTSVKKVNLLTVKNRLIATFLILLLVPGSLIGYFSYRSSSGKVQEQLVDAAQSNVELLNQTIQQYIQLEMQDVDMLSKQLSSGMIDRKDPQGRKIVDGFTSNHPELELLTMGNENGAWMKSPDPGPQDYDPRTRDWYKGAKGAPGQVVVSDPYVSVTTKNVVVTIAKVLQDGQGVVGVNLSLQKLADIVSGVKIGSEGYVYVFDRNSKFIIHPKNAPGQAANGVHYAEMLKQNSGVISYDLKGVQKRAAFTTNPATGWKIVGTMELGDIENAAKPILRTTLIVLLAALAAGAVLAYWIIRSITVPLMRLTEASVRISEGDLTKAISIRSNDELGRVAASFNRMIESLRRVLSEIGETSSQLAAASEQMTASAEQTSQASGQITDSIQNAAAGMETQTINVRDTAKVMEEMSAGIQRIADSSGAIVEASSKTEEDVRRGNETVREVKRQMALLRESVEQLASGIYELAKQSADVQEMNAAITDISNRTNLLSLNAAIEAARAGEHGKGFSVVASEVRKLADQSGKTAENIHSVISGMAVMMKEVTDQMQARVAEAEQGLSAVERAEAAFAQIESSTRHIVQQIYEISAVTEQMSASSEQVAASANDMAERFRESSGSFSQVSAASEEQLASMEEISGSAAGLTKMAEKLQTVLDRFKL